MTDVHSPEVRSKNMRAIRGRDTRPELFLRKSLHKAGFRYRISPTDLPGKPDIYLPRYRTVVFVHGCFWHCHGCYLFKLPLNRRDFWLEKLSGNVQRDQRNLKLLLDSGYRLLVIWECAVKGKNKLNPDQLIAKIIEWLITGDARAVADSEGFTDSRKSGLCFCRYCGRIPDDN